MWEFMNGMTDGIRSRIMPRRRNGIGTMTALVIGASVGIAAWETMRRNNINILGHNSATNSAADLASQVVGNIQD